ncbi:MAG: arylsulfatase [Acidobacteriales bacterium]|nr:MAG: arylsulfatase [Terriglobales bacterium]
MRLSAASANPNILLIYADDLGYGDLSCYGGTGVKTPNLDRLAAAGLRFTDAHSSAATCTPSRYSLLTGEYSFRRKEARVLPGDAPLLIEPGRETLAALLKKAGYRTGVVGKWHLGLGSGNVDWNGDIRPGPIEIGFDESFIIPATGDRVPCVYVDGHRVAGLDSKDPIRVSYQAPIGSEPTGATNPELLKMHPSHGHDMAIVNGVSRIGYMTGGKSALWVDEDMGDVLARRAVRFIDTHKSTPFFLYFSTHDIHVPRLPHTRFSRFSSMGPRGGAIAQLDWCVGELLKTLDRLRLTGNTLVVFSSDNGPVVDDGYKDEAVGKLGAHRPAGSLRGGKYSNFEAGTRVPLIVNWPGRAKSGVSDALISQVDFLRSLAALSGRKPNAGAAPDSVDLLPVLLGESARGREELVEQASALSLRQGKWKMIEPGKGERINKNVNIETGIDPQPQLYDVIVDRGETTDLAVAMPDKVREMRAILDQIRAGKRPPR